MKYVLNIIIFFVYTFVLIINIFPQNEKSIKKFTITEQDYFSEAEKVLDDACTNNDVSLFIRTVDVYKEFLNKYPNSSNAPAAYMVIAKIDFDNLKNYNEVIDIYMEVIEKFSTSDEAKIASFEIPLIYDDIFHDKENANIYYKKFIDKYSQSAVTEEDIKMIETAKVFLEDTEIK
jgi:tetratricopeptide (TPR) repeat protein